MTKPSRSQALLLLCLTLTLFPASDLLASISYQGIASDLDSDKVYYREVHCVITSDQADKVTEAAGNKQLPLTAEKVLYLDTQKDKIATKNLRGNLNLLPSSSSSQPLQIPDGINPGWVPEYEFVHHGTGQVEGLRYQGGELVLYRRDGENADWENKSLSFAGTSDNVIADAGFDQFIRDHLAEFLAGKSLEFTYLSAPRLSTLDFTLKPKTQTDNEITLKMYPSNFVIRLLVDPIEVTYQINTGRLLAFKGLTNVPRNADKNYIASIQYLYGEDLDAFCN